MLLYYSRNTYWATLDSTSEAMLKPAWFETYVIYTSLRKVDGQRGPGCSEGVNGEQT